MAVPLGTASVVEVAPAPAVVDGVDPVVEVEPLACSVAPDVVDDGARARPTPATAPMSTALAAATSPTTAPRLMAPSGTTSSPGVAAARAASRRPASQVSSVGRPGGAGEDEGRPGEEEHDVRSGEVRA